MAKIVYSLAQEGRGHSSRALEIIRRLLAKKHKVTVLTGGESYEVLSEAFKRQKRFRIHLLPGMNFAYDQHGSVDYLRTIKRNVRPIAKGRKIIQGLAELIENEKYVLAISDFEPFLPRAAKQKDLPFINIDNQHRIVFEKASTHHVRAKQAVSYMLTKEIIRQWHPLGKKLIIASIFVPNINRTSAGETKIYTVGPIIRKDILDLRRKTKEAGFTLVYVKRALEPAIIPVIEKLNGRFRMFVKDPASHKSNGHISYEKQSGKDFAKALAECDAVISTAGEQVMSEALFLGKPLLLLPEQGTYEQQLNAEMVKARKVGDAKDITKVKPEDIRAFLRRIPTYRKNIKKMRVQNGTEKIMRLISEELKQ